MLKKENRLPKTFFKGERLLKSPFFDLKIGRNGGSLSRFAFVVSKKIDKRATARNRIRRKFRSCIEENLENIGGGYDFLFILRKNILEKNFCLNLINLLKREKLYNENLVNKTS